MQIYLRSIVIYQELFQVILVLFLDLAKGRWSKIWGANFLCEDQAVGKCWNLGIRFRGTKDFARHKFGKVNANCLTFLSLRTLCFSRRQKCLCLRPKCLPLRHILSNNMDSEARSQVTTAWWSVKSLNGLFKKFDLMLCFHQVWTDDGR